MKFRTVAFAVFAVGGICMPANAGKLYDFRVQKLVMNSGVAEATVKMTNTSGHYMPRVDIRCEFKDAKGKTIEVGWRRYLRLAVGKTEYTTVQAKTGTETPRKVSCEVRWYQF